MPWPSKVTVAQESYALPGPFVVSWEGDHDEQLERAVRRFAADVQQRTGLARGAAGPALRISVARGGLQRAEISESYTLAIDGAGVRIAAPNSIGVLRGLASLRQLIVAGQDGFELPRIAIADAPRFAWRGLMIDVARHFVSLPTLKRQIDAMERVKLNVLHLHLSDSEAFRVESRRYPRLTQVSARGGYYSWDEIRDLVAYAADRGVRIVPEFDVPGHTGAILTAYPELSATPVDPADPIGLRNLAIDPTRPEAQQFIEGLFEEMSGLFPDRYFHVGGDEVPAAAWKANPTIQAYMSAQGLEDQAALQSHFFKKVKALMNRLGKVTIGWEEVARGEVDDDVVVQAWRSSQASSHITAQNNRVIVSAGYYLDLLRPGLRHYAIDPLDVLATPPDRPADVLGPAPTAPMNERQAALVLGAEAPLWTEVVSDEMVDGRLWPRAALLAERFWSASDVRDPADASRRLAVVHEGLRIQGLADDVARHRMAARLGPEDVGAVETLVAASAPIRNFGRLWEVVAAIRAGQAIRLPELNSLADIAAPDSMEAHRLASRVERFLAGDRAETAALKAELTIYRDNHSRFVAAATGRRALEAALPVSADIAALAQAGLDAIGFLERDERPGPQWSRGLEPLFKRQADAEAASSSIAKVWSGAVQPPAGLLISVAPMVQRLVQAAANEGRRTSLMK